MKAKTHKTIRVRAYAELGGHNQIFMFLEGLVAERYPTLLHVYNKKVTKDLKPVFIEYKVRRSKK